MWKMCVHLCVRNLFEMKVKDLMVELSEMNPDWELSLEHLGCFFGGGKRVLDNIRFGLQSNVDGPGAYGDAQAAVDRPYKQGDAQAAVDNVYKQAKRHVGN